ncbi:MAG: hypothetical protein ACI867_001212, partial [Glaciecola sp.]
MRSPRFLSVTLSVALTGSGLAVVPALPASAAVTFNVDSQADAADADLSDGDCRTAAFECTLRAAVMQAGSFAGNDTIVLPAGSYALGSALDVNPVNSNDTLTIRGAGMGVTTIDGNNGLTRDAQGGWTIEVGVLSDAHRAISVNGGQSLTLEGLTISDAGDFPDVGLGVGGAVAALAGTLTVDSVEFVGNGVDGYGGAIGAQTPLTITDSTFRGNGATEGGGAVSTTAGGQVTRTIIEDNTAYVGGGIWQAGPLLTVIDSSIVGNTAQSAGGAIWSKGNENPLLRATNTSLVGNSAPVGGALHVDDSYGYGQARLEHVTVAHNTAASWSQLSAASDAAIHLWDSIIDWDVIAAAGATGVCTNVRLRGGNVVSDGTGCDAVAFSETNNVDGGRILSPWQGTSAREVGAGHLGQLITPEHAATTAADSCAGDDARGALRPTTGCSAGAIQAGHLVTTKVDELGNGGSLRYALEIHVDGAPTGGLVAIELTTDADLNYGSHVNFGETPADGVIIV